MMTTKGIWLVFHIVLLGSDPLFREQMELHTAEINSHFRQSVSFTKKVRPSDKLGSEYIAEVIGE